MVFLLSLLMEFKVEAKVFIFEVVGEVEGGVLLLLLGEKLIVGRINTVEVVEVVAETRE